MRLKKLGLLVAFAMGAGLAPAQSAREGVPVSVVRPVVHPASYQAEPIPTAPTGGQNQGSAPGPMTGADAAVADGQPESAAAARQRKQDELKLTHYGPYERMWFGGGPLLMWMKDGPNPAALVTSGGRTLFGNGSLDFEEFWGWHANGGFWFDCKHTWGAEFGGFLTEQKSIGASFAGPVAGTTDLSRPIFDVNAGVPTNVVVASPGIFAGSIGISATSNLGGLEFNLIRNLRHCEAGNFDLLFGFRYLDLEESLNIAQQSRILSAGGTIFFANGALPPNFPAAFPPATSSSLPVGSVVTVADRFYTRNQMYAGQVGGRWEMWRGPFYFSALGKVALGPNHETQKFTGSSTATVPGGTTQTRSGGLLVVPPANLGRFTTDWFAVAPEVGLTAGMQVTDLVRVSLGYNFLYVNSVVRPGSQVNTVVNSSLVPTSAPFGATAGITPPPTLLFSQPRVLTRQDDILAHGFTLSVELRY